MGAPHATTRLPRSTWPRHGSRDHLTLMNTIEQWRTPGAMPSVKTIQPFNRSTLPRPKSDYSRPQNFVFFASSVSLRWSCCAVRRPCADPRAVSRTYAHPFGTQNLKQREEIANSTARCQVEALTIQRLPLGSFSDETEYGRTRSFVGPAQGQHDSGMVLFGHNDQLARNLLLLQDLVQEL